MKYLHILWILMISFSALGQDQYARTADGKLVLLKKNGTWEYVNDQPKNFINSQSSKTEKPKVEKKQSTGIQYIRGPRGGCYYINRNGNKTYVDRSMCN